MKELNSPADTIYASPHNDIAPFAFNEQVADVFPDMLTRSIPGFDTIIKNVGLLTNYYACEDSYCYDLGCSLGISTLSMRRSLSTAIKGIIAVDNSPVMARRCMKNVRRDNSTIPVHVICADVCDLCFEQASVVVMNFTLQFITPQKRKELLDRICKGMRNGGVLIISEKIQFEEQEEQEQFSQLYYEFKRYNGYSDLEISQKRTALENVLLSDTVQKHTDRLYEAGFTSVAQWFQCFNFVSLLARK